MERWISDGLDGRTSEKATERSSVLAAHLADCPSCRAWRDAQEKLQAEALRPETGPGPEYFARSLAALRSRLEAEDRAAPKIERHGPAFFPRGRWAWEGAATLLLVAGGMFVMLTRSRPFQDVYFPPFDEPLASFEHVLAESPEMEAEFDAVVKSSLAEPWEWGRAEVEPLLNDQALFVESLTDDEVRVLDAVILKQIKRKD